MWSRDAMVPAIVLTIVAVGQIAASILLYNQEGHDYLRNIGWIVLVVSAVFGWLPIYTFRKMGGVDKGKSYMQTTVLVDKGVYGIVRHPQYVAGVLINLALALIAQQWVVTVLGAIAAVMYYLGTAQEERSCVEKFGESYRRYQEQVPRMNFVLGILRAVRR